MTMLTKENISSFKIKNEEFVIVPKNYFLSLQRDYSNFVNKEEYPKFYTEIDEEGTWETVDFGPKGINSKELLDHLRK